jgi:thiol:disulfide interchange protein DsbD
MLNARFLPDGFSRARLALAGLALALLLAMTTGTGHAQPVRTDHVEAELVAEQQALVPGQPATLALRLRHAPQWHTYWRNPGDAGVATQVQWQLPAGFAAGALNWPVPERIPVPPLANYGYTGEVLLIAPLTVPALMMAGEVTLRAHVDWLVCKDICIPGGADLALTLPVVQGSPVPDPRWSTAFATTRARLPQAMPGLAAQAQARGRFIDLTIRCPACAGTPPREAYFFAATEGLVEPSRAQRVSVSDGALQLRLPVAVDLTATGSIVEGVLVTQPPLDASLPGVTLTAELSGKPEAGVPMPAHASEPAPELLSVSSLAALGFALLGGLILNLMPCVFPVLSLKILAFVREAHGEAAALRRQGLAFAAGVVLSFAVLAGLILLLRAGGDQLGWGFQLQSPGMVAGLATLFVLLTLNLLGAFELALPAIGGRGHEEHRPLAAAFLSGLLAAVVASPCTAPFMGAALGYALLQDTAGALGIFVALGLGMALPYVVLTWHPALLRRLPAPGPWLVWLRRALALPLAATVGWLLWVLMQQVDESTLARVIVGLVLVSMASLIYGRVQWRSPGLMHRLALSLAAAGVVIVTTSLLRADAPELRGDTASHVSTWSAWSQDAVDEAIAGDRAVFVDFTAAWCVTCQVNKRLVLDSPAVLAAFEQAQVLRLRADWTRRDAAITQALASLGRNGVPVYVLYQPGKPAQILPELLTESTVLSAIAQARR